MDNLFLQKKKKENIFCKNEKELFYNFLKDKDDILIQKKMHNNYINSLQNSINNGLILLDKTEINKENYKIKKRNLVIKNNFNNTKNESRDKNSSWKNFGVLKNKYLSQKTLLTTPNSNKNKRNDFNIKDKVRKKLFILKGENKRRIQSCRKHRETSKNDFFSDYFKSSKYLNISPIIKKTKKLKKNQTVEKYSKTNNYYILNDFNSHNYSIKNYGILSLKTFTNRPSSSSSIEKAEKRIGLFNNKFKIEKRIKKILNNTVLKFDRNKFKIYSNKKIFNTANKLSESKKSNEKLKEYKYVKKIYEEVYKKKKKSSNEIRSSSLSHNRILNKKQLIYKKAIRKYFAKPNREMKDELSKYIKNRNFIIDADNNPYRFKIFNSIYNF